MRGPSRGWPAFAALAPLLATPTARADTTVIRADETVRVDRSGTASVGTDATRTRRLLDTIRARAHDLGLDAALADGLVLEATTRPALSDPALEIVTVRGRYHGAPLSRPVARALVDVADDGRVRLLTAGAAIGPSSAGIPTIGAAQALGILDASGLPASRGAIEARLTAVAGPARTVLAWRIDPPPDLSRMQNPVFMVDAHDGSVWIDHDQVLSADVVSFETNPVTTPTAQRFALVSLDPDPPSLTGPWFRVQNCPDLPIDDEINCVARSTAVPDADGHFLYPAPDVSIAADNVQMDDTFAEVSLYYHVDKFMQSLFDIGFPGLGCHQDGELATLVANHKQWIDDAWVPVDNAYWTGSCSRTMVFGQGTQVDFAYDGDVVYHELGHGVIGAQYGAYLGPRRRLEEAFVVDSGATNEAIADFLSSSYAGDPYVADYVGTHWDKLEDGYIRNNDNAYACPADLVGQNHVDGEPFAALLWRAFERHGDAVVPIVLDMIAMLPPDSPTFEESAATLETVVDAVLGEDAATALHDDVVARGLVDCLRVTTPDTLRRSLYVREPRDLVPFAPPPLQLRFDVPEGAESMELSYELYSSGTQDGGEATYDAAILVRYGTHVTFTWTEEDDGTTTVDGEWELQLDDVDDGHASIPVRGTESIFVAFVNGGEELMNVDEIVAEFPGVGGTGSGSGSGTGTGSGSGGGGETTDGPGETDGPGKTDGSGAPTYGDDEPHGADDKTVPHYADDGCGCTATPGAPAVFPLALVLAALGPRRRRLTRRTWPRRRRAPARSAPRAEDASPTR